MKRMIERQVNRVWRRLFLSALLERLAWAWSAALLLAAAWFLVGPYLLDGARWPALAALLGLSTLAAVVLSVRRAPTAVAAALSLDERFGLKERTTTALTLSPGEAESRAGQALLDDAEGRVAALRVGDRFPVTLPLRAAATLPLGILAVVLLALLWNPDFTKADADDEAAVPPADARAKLEEQMKKLAAPKAPEKKPGEPEVKKEDLAKIDADVEKFTRKPRDTKDEVRERIKDAMAIEDDIRRRQKEQAERAEAMKERFQQADRLARKQREPPKGPADKVADAFARGDMDKAADELERLGRRLDKPAEAERLRKKRDEAKDEDEKRKAQEDLDELEREQDLQAKDKDDLQKQLDGLEDQLKELTRDKQERKKALDEMAERGEIDKDQLDREKDELDRNAERLTDEEKQELKDLADKLAECKKCMNEGKAGEAAKKLAEAGKKCEGMCKDGEGKEMARRLAQMKEVRKALGRGLGGAGPGAGRRPLADDKGDTGKEEKWSPAEWDKGKIEVTGDGPKGGYKGPRKPAEMQAEIEQAAQQAPAAIDRQRLPPAARKMARGYFEKVRGPEKDAKKP